MKKAWRREDRHTAAFSGCRGVATIVVRIKVGRREGLVCRQVRACHRRLTTSPLSRALQISNSTPYSAPFQYSRCSAGPERAWRHWGPSEYARRVRALILRLPARVEMGRRRRLSGSDVADSWH